VRRRRRAGWLGSALGRTCWWRPGGARSRRGCRAENADVGLRIEPGPGDPGLAGDAGTSSVTELASEFPFGIARRGYTVGSAVLEAILPPNEDPVATAPVTFSDEGIEEREGVEAKTIIVQQLVGALDVIRHHDPAWIATLGGECAVRVAPFSELARRYGNDLAILWIDSHPDIGTPANEYPGFMPWRWRC